MQKKAKTIATGTTHISVLKLSLFIFGLIFVPLLSSAQTECPESIPPQFDPEHEPRTLCQKYSPPGKFPNRFGTPTTSLASEIIWNLNNGSEIFTGDIDLVGDLVIDQNFTLLNCKVRIWPNVKIRVEADVTFTLDGSKLFCCQDMWQGIDLDYRSTVVSRHVTEIEDAMVAMESPCTATMSIRNTIFNRNTVGIRLGKAGPLPWDPCPSFPMFTQFSSNTFQCNAPLNGTADGVSYVGVQVFKTNATIGALTSVPDTFRNIQFGVRFESQWWGTSVVNRCRFENILNDGIFMAQGNLRVEQCFFRNNGFRGINVEETRGLVAQNNHFNLNDDVAAQASASNIYHHIQAAGFALNCAVNINHNFFVGNFIDIAKEEQLKCIELVGGVSMGGGTSIRIEFNDFNIIDVDVPTGVSYASDAILLSGEFPLSSSAIIELNTFYLDHPSNAHDDSDLRGISLIDANKNNVSIYSNSFDSDAWGPLSQPSHEFGIFLWGSSTGTGNEVSGNTFALNLNTARSNSYIRGITSLDYTGTTFCQNDLRECNSPMFFSGTSMGTQYIRNIHTGCGICLTVQAGYIGEQGIEGGKHNGNEWYDKILRPEMQAFHFPPQQALNSRIWASTPQSERNPNNQPGYVYFSEYHPADVDPDQMDEWFKEDPTGFPSTDNCIAHLAVSSVTDKAIAGGTINISQLSAAHVWTGKRYLYTKLMRNLALQDDYVEFGAFLTNESQTSVGKLYNVEQKISDGLAVSVNLAAQLTQLKSAEGIAISNLLLADSVLDISTDALALASANNSKNVRLSELHTLDSLYNELNTAYQAALMTKLQEALALNDAIIASSSYEQYEKTVNEIAIRQVLYQNGELTLAQVAILNAIATECPKYAGHGVYRARGLPCTGFA